MQALLDSFWFLIISGAISYIVGSVSSAIIVCRIAGLPDPRTQGSNNPGATNVLRIGGKKAAAITLTGDMLKGLFPVAIVTALGAEAGVIALCAFCAFLGHLYPLFFQLQGGKGVATFFGTLLGINLYTGALALLCWLLCAFVLRISSVSALITALLAPLLVWHFTHSVIIILSATAMTIMLLIRHRSNIRDLIDGSENKIGSGEDGPASSD